jgi:hypothetical protein
LVLLPYLREGGETEGILSTEGATADEGREVMGGARGATAIEGNEAMGRATAVDIVTAKRERGKS